MPVSGVLHRAEACETGVWGRGWGRRGWGSKAMGKEGISRSLAAHTAVPLLAIPSCTPTRNQEAHLHIAQHGLPGLQHHPALAPATLGRQALQPAVLRGVRQTEHSWGNAGHKQGGCRVAEALNAKAHALMANRAGRQAGRQ